MIYLLDVVNVTLLVGHAQRLPSILTTESSNAVSDAVHAALDLLVPFLAANLALLRGLGWAIRRAMTDLTAQTTLASELALDTRVGAVGLVVPMLAAVVALPRIATFSRTVRAVASEVAVLTTAVQKRVSKVSLPKQQAMM